MAHSVVMPKLGMTMTEGTVTAWLRKEGDCISEGEPLFEVETDKLTNTVNALDSGTLLKIIVNEGETVECQTAVAVLGTPGEDVSRYGAEKQEKPSDNSSDRDKRIIISPRAKAVANELGVDIREINGSGPNGRIVERDVRSFAKNEEEMSRQVKYSPLAKKIAEENGINAADVPSDGRVMSEDVLKYLKNSGNDNVNKEQPEETVRMSGMRRAIAKNMLNSHMTSPTVTFNLRVDMTNLKSLREQLKIGGMNVSFTDIIVRFVARALTEYPALNCSINGDSIVYKHYVNIGIAVALEDGLLVPNIKDADKKTIAEISREAKALAEEARNGRLSPDSLRGGTFTVTNLGMFGIESFTPIINQPEAAILGVCAIEETPVAINGAVTVRPMMNLCLTADHRAIDGAVAAGFMQRLKTLMENPALMMT